MKINDAMLQFLWCELSDIAFLEDSEYRFILESAWYVPGILFFQTGTEQMEIWEWFDNRHTKGVAWLLNEFNEYEWKRGQRICV